MKDPGTQQGISCQEPYQPTMNYQTNQFTRLGAFVATAILGTGAACAATTSSKDGMQTTGQVQQSGYAEDGLPMLAAGVQELRLNGGLNWADETAYNLDISYGRFLTANWQVGVQGSLVGVNSDKSYGIGVFGEYNYLTGTKWVPFVRGTVSYMRPNEGDDSAALGLDAGVKYFMRSNLAISASVGGDWMLQGDGDDGFNKQLDIGLNFYF